MFKIYDFYAEWCGPCKMMSPQLEVFQAMCPDVELIAVDADSEKELVAQYAISSIPTLVFIKNDEEVARLTGYTTAVKMKSVVDNYGK